jgi:molybdate transport system substrate-binding protein
MLIPCDLSHEFKQSIFQLRALMKKSVFIRGAMLVAILVSSATGVVAEEATLAAGAGFRRPLSEVAAAYEQATGHKILQIYGHMGQVMAQARESGQLALVCGDQALLKGAGGVTFERFTRLGPGKLVVAYRKGITLAKADDIAGESIARIGTPDQANAIYGKAGQQFLERAGLTDKVAPKLVKVGTVPQVTSYVISGEVDAGFVNATDAIGAGANIGGYVEVGQDFYDPVDVSCGAVAGKPSQAADGFLAFLATPQARAILTRYGL